jgi:hypothetical protein
MTKQTPRKCRCPSGDHEHKPGKCQDLATEQDQLCKPCSEKEAAALQLKAERSRTQSHNSDFPLRLLNVEERPSAEPIARRY